MKTAAQQSEGIIGQAQEAIDPAFAAGEHLGDPHQQGVSLPVEGFALHQMAAAYYATGGEFGLHQQGRGPVETSHPKEEAGTKVQANRTAAGVDAALEPLRNDGDAQPRRQGQAQHPGGAELQIRNLQGARLEPQALETIGAQGAEGGQARSTTGVVAKMRVAADGQPEAVEGW